MSYVHQGPPFNFLGHFSETQLKAFEAWTTANGSKFSEIEVFYRARAQQLRKTAGLLEVFYAAKATPLRPSFVKGEWRPDAAGHFLPTTRDDRLPADAMAVIKDRFQDQLAADDEAVFRMNLLRVRFESYEDLAQEAHDAPAVVSAKLKDVKRYFADPQYSGALVRDKSDLYQGEPRYRVHPLDPPTAWERLNAGQQVPNT